MLDDISGVRAWSKVNSGMQKMFRGEVLSKLPIMQHMLFGRALAFRALSGRSEGDETGAERAIAGKEEVYAFGMETPTCCGMRIPSKFGSGLEDARRGTRPIPFD
jgi:serine/threonine-protein phosphatase 2A activator